MSAVKHRHGLLDAIKQAIRSPSVERRFSSYSLSSPEEERIKKENRVSLPAIATSIIPYSKTTYQLMTNQLTKLTIWELGN